MAKVTSIKEKQDEKLAIELLKEIRKAREFYDFSGDKLDNNMIAWIVREKLEWWAM